MGSYDENGNWIEEFRSRPYKTREEASDKIRAVIDFHVNESGWMQNGQPRIEEKNGEFVAVIPLKKMAETNSRGRR